jgi:hypothetical protein
VITNNVSDSYEYIYVITQIICNHSVELEWDEVIHQWGEQVIGVVVTYLKVLLQHSSGQKGQNYKKPQPR